MNRGYMGRILNVNLTNGHMEDEPLDEKQCRDFVGGYGLGARWLFDRIPTGTEALGPDNILGILTGPLTGTPCIGGTRWTAVCKSPLTNTWGDANCGGTLGPHLKMAGYDGVLFYGASERPVYLWINDGKAELRDASHLWGMDTNQTEDTIKGECGDSRGVKVASIGVAGEKLSRIACIINDYGRAAGRSGVGAVMGSKRVKAIAVRGMVPVPLHDKARADTLRRQYLQQKSANYNWFHTKGTPSIIGVQAENGRSPVKNWGGVGIVDFKNGIEEYGEEKVMSYEKAQYACYRCPIACGGHMAVTEPGPYQGAKAHNPEYETGAAFGSMTLMANLPALIKINDLCNRYGLDTMSAGSTVAFAIECFEKGLITQSDTDGLILRWGDDRAIITLLEKIAKREGIGDILAEGTQRAAVKIGRGAEAFAIHIGGQEVPMHHPIFLPGYITTYIVDATPGRHMQGGDMAAVAGLPTAKYDAASTNPHNRAEYHKFISDIVHVVNAAGECLFAHYSYNWPFIADFLEAVTGWEWSLETVQRTGERIGTMRHLFNLREGVNFLKYPIPGRVVGDPPQAAGPIKERTVDYRTMVREYLKHVDWDLVTTVPSRRKLEELGLGDLVPLFYEAKAK